MRTTALITVLVALVLPHLAGCGSDEGRSETTAPSPSAATTEDAPEPVWKGATIPDGDYRTVLDQRDKARWRLTLSDEELEWRSDGRLESVLRIRGDQWSQAADYRGGPMTVGASGTLTYDEQGRLVVEEPCCGRARFTWTLERGLLRWEADLAFAEREHPAFDVNSQETREWLLMSSGPFRRVPGTP